MSGSSPSDLCFPLGTPYKPGADGVVDREPRFDDFDRTRFVETVMGVSLESDLDLQKIRYKDAIGYAMRNDLIVPNNVRVRYWYGDSCSRCHRGFVQDIEEDMVPAEEPCR